MTDTLRAEIVPALKSCGLPSWIPRPWNDIGSVGPVSEVRRALAVLGLSADSRRGKVQDYRDLDGNVVANLSYADDGRACVTFWRGACST